MDQATHPQGATARAGIGFHPYALRSPSAVEDPLALVGRRVHRRMLDPHATADVAIIDGAIGERIEGCNGPRRDGSCPGVAAGLTVPCAGRRIRGELCVASRHFCFDVAAEATRCPLAWLVETLTGMSGSKGPAQSWPWPLSAPAADRHRDPRRRSAADAAVGAMPRRYE